MQNITRSEEYFNSLIAPPKVKKKRSCMKCRKVFISDSAGHRICTECKVAIATLGYRAEHIVESI
jgi:hypothetical protein